MSQLQKNASAKSLLVKCEHTAKLDTSIGQIRWR